MLETVPRRTKSAGEDTESLSMRVPTTMLARLRDIAEREDRTLTAQILRVLREWLAEKEAQKP